MSEPAFFHRFTGRLADLLLPVEQYRPFPPAEERPGWERLDPELRAAVVAIGEGRLDDEWPPLPATLFMEFGREGNRSRYEQPHFARRHALAQLVLAECVEAQGRFLDQVTNGVWAICEESFWGVPAHNRAGLLPDSSDPIIDLFAAETGALLAWTHYLLERPLDSLSPLVTARIRREMRQRILDPFIERDDFWWMGAQPHRLNNWSPWCTSNCLAAALLLEQEPARRVAATEKSLVILDRFLATYQPDGGCDEGPGYWTRAGASLFDCLELLLGATGGRLDVYAEPLIREIGRYAYRAHIAGDWYANFADGSARLSMPADLLFRYGRRIGDDRLAGLGAETHRRHCEGKTPAADLPPSLPRGLPALFGAAELTAWQQPYAPPRQVWLPNLQVMVAREAESERSGWYVAAKGGHNAEQHNHNDVGHFIIYLDGEPLIIDPGVGTYTAQTFSARRYELWTMQSAYHNLPTVNGCQQPAGQEYAARDVECKTSDGTAEMAMELAGAYPPAAGLTSWRRVVRLTRQPAAVEVEDRWQTAGPAEVVLSLMTPCEPIVAAGAVRLGPAVLDIGKLAATVEPMPMADDRLRSIWGERLYRLLLRPADAGPAGASLLRFTRAR